MRSSDDLDYAMGARDLIEGRYKPESFHQLRLGVVLPAAAGLLLFGRNHTATVLWPMAASILSIAVLYAMVLRNSSKTVATIAALLLAVSTQHVLSGAELFPDAAFTLWILLGLHLYGREREEGGRPVFYALAGLCFYAAFATRIEALKFAPAIVAVEAWFIRKRGMDRKAFWLPAGALVPVALECGFFALATGHPFERMREVTAVQDWSQSTGSNNMGLWPMLKSLVSPLGAFGLAFPVACAGVLRLKRERRLGVALFVAAYALGSALLVAGLYRLADGRFYTLVSPFVAWFAAEAIAKIPRERIRIALVAGLALLMTLLVHARLPADTMRAYAELREVVSSRDVPVYSDPRTVAAMKFYHPGVRAAQYRKGLDLEPPCWLVDHERVRWIDRSLYGVDGYPGDQGTLVRSIPLDYRGLPGFMPAVRVLFRWRGVGGIEQIRVFRIP
jgi:4-amino-4-deoxy-L-arabinose transferase-like glycosyltransferase